MLYKLWLNEWLENYVRPSNKPQTYDCYRKICVLHIIPTLGNIDMDKITILDLQKHVTDLMHKGNLRTGKGLSSNSINSVISVIQNSLNRAFLIGVASQYIANRIKRPRCVEKQIECLTLIEQKKIEKYILESGKDKYFGILLCLYSGVRIGELLALTWDDIDLSKRMLTVSKSCRQEPKNANNLSKLNNAEIKADKQIVRIDNRQNVFPGIPGAEWVNIIFWKKGYDNGLDGEQLVLMNGSEPMSKELIWEAATIQKPQQILDLLECVKKTGSYIPLQKYMSVLKPYGLRTDVFGNFEKYHIPSMSEERISNTDIKVIGLKQVRYIPRDYPLPKRTNALDKYKVFVPYAWGNMSPNAGLGGAFADIIIAKPYEICTETYLESGCFDSLDKAQEHAKYLMTKFARAMLFVNKTSQHSTTAWGDVPVQDYTEYWWNKTIAEIDEHLFAKYNVPEDVADYIRKNIQTKDESNIINFI